MIYTIKTQILLRDQHFGITQNYYYHCFTKLLLLFDSSDSFYELRAKNWHSKCGKHACRVTRGYSRLCYTRACKWDIHQKTNDRNDCRAPRLERDVVCLVASVLNIMKSNGYCILSLRLLWSRSQSFSVHKNNTPDVGWRARKNKPTRLITVSLCDARINYLKKPLNYTNYPSIYH